MRLFEKKHRVVELSDLRDFVDGVMRYAGSTTITVNVKELHIHQAGSNYYAAQIERPTLRALQEPSQTLLLPEDEDYRAGPTECPECWHILQPGEGVFRHGRYYHEGCAARAWGH